ncbi:hypothetical protein PA08_0459 [Cutibacterium modestum P08]|nr:hypothetical protein PA08_0459 [Cutibacterium modestum P08]
MKIVAMDGFTGFKTAASEEISQGHRRDGPFPHDPPGR